MSVTDELSATAERVEDLREGLGRVRGVIEQADSVLTVADDLLGKADEMIAQANEALEQSRRWAPRVAIALGVVAVAAIGTVVVLRMRRRNSDD
ncbi:MAG: hypothetical protein KGN38_00285 [Actinomycetales bacterium]|nr:hypothetical protein [Actinomycetales bacterium]